MYKNLGRGKLKYISYKCVLSLNVAFIGEGNLEEKHPGVVRIILKTVIKNYRKSGNGGFSTSWFVLGR